jgi:hypothetical protein
LECGSIGKNQVCHNVEVNPITFEVDLIAPHEIVAVQTAPVVGCAWVPCRE